MDTTRSIACTSHFLGRIALLLRCGLLLQTEWRDLSVDLSVTIVSLAKTANPLAMSDSGGPKEPGIRWGSLSPHVKGQYEEGKGLSIVKYKGRFDLSVILTDVDVNARQRLSTSVAALVVANYQVG